MPQNQLQNQLEITRLISKSIQLSNKTKVKKSELEMW